MARSEETVSAWWYMIGGAALGYALGIITAPQVQGMAEEAQSDETPGLGRRILRRIPTGVKAAGAAGAIRGAGKEAYREAKENIQEKIT